MIPVRCLLVLQERLDALIVREYLSFLWFSKLFKDRLAQAAAFYFLVAFMPAVTVIGNYDRHIGSAELVSRNVNQEARDN